MALTNLAPATASVMVQAITSTGLYVSIHSANPGTTGANELAGGTAYSGTRPAVTWGTITNGTTTSTDTQTFNMIENVPGGIPYIGIWTAATGGSFLDSGQASGLTNAIASGAVVTFVNGLTLTVAG